MIEIRKKYLRFLVSEHHFRLRFAAIFLCILIIVFQNKMLLLQKRKLISLQSRKQFISKIPEMEKTMADRSKMDEALDFVSKSRELTFQGTSNQQGLLNAIIDGKVLKEGDTIANYLVKEIKVGFVQLENIDTKEILEFYSEY